MPKSIRIDRVVFESGERFSVLLGDDGLPVVLPMRYVVLVLRQKNQWRTIDATLRAIRWLYVWCIEKEIDLENRLRYGPELTSFDLASFAQYIRMGRPDTKVVASLGRNENAPLGATINRTLDWVAAFLTWAMETQRRGEFAKKVLSPGATPAVVLGRQRLPKGAVPYKKGISETGFIALMDAAKPSAKNNPFLKNKLRNYAILRLMFETGLRRGECAALYVSDVETRAGQYTVSIFRRPDNPLDSRVDAPTPKTLERVIPITEDLARIIIEYTVSHRGRTRHPYLFTSRKRGTPLGMDAYNHIFEMFRGVHPDLAKLTSHDARRTFNDRFFRKLSEANVDPDSIASLQNYICGWTVGSHQGQGYARGAIEAKAMEIAKQLQGELYKV